MNNNKKKIIYLYLYIILQLLLFLLYNYWYCHLFIYLFLFLGDYSLEKNHFSSAAFMKFHLGFCNSFFFSLLLIATFLCPLHLLYFFHCYHWAHCTDDGDDDIFIIIDTINLFISIPIPPPLSIIAFTHSP